MITACRDFISSIISSADFGVLRISSTEEVSS
jgi:hypothetical protein